MKLHNTKIFITGGHLAPAVALIEEIQSRKLPWTVLFIGRNNSFEGTKSVSREQQSIRAKGIRFIPITTGRIQRAISLNSLLSLCKIPVGIFQAFLYCIGERPGIIVSFGGYIAVPVTLAGWILGIPVITHEQTLVPGLANRMIARIARVVCITFEETARYFPENKVRYTGLPVRRAILESAQKNPFPVLNKQLPLLYITGGTTGSQSINDLVFPIIPDLVARYTVVHQTGVMSYFKARDARKSLPEEFQKRYIIKEYFPDIEAAWLLQNASLVLARSGANTVMELAVLSKHAILIPLPWAGAGEQLKQALWLQQLGLGHVMDQKTTTSDTLREQINLFMKQSPAGSPRQDLPLHKDAASRVVKIIESL